MIVYIASYPRSGNFWVQTLLGNQFKYITTRVHWATQDDEGYLSRIKQQMKAFFGNMSKNTPAENSHKAVEDIDELRSRNKRTAQRWFGIHLNDISGDKSNPYPPELSKWMLRYQVEGSPAERYYIINGCPLLQQIETRKILAESAQYFFIKTHFAPYPEYFPGEYVIQLVRNPGAAIWSYYNFQRDIRNKNTSLKTMIKRDPEFGGNWSEYYQKWLKAADKIGKRYFLAKYEEIAAGELVFCDKLHEFLGLPILSRELRSFDYYHQMRPLLTRKGKTSGWEENFSKNQLKLLWQVHAEMLSHFGYLEPNYDIGLEKEIH